MKSAKAPPAEAPSSRRSQPVRQTRTNPPRTNSGLNRSMTGRESLASANVADHPIDIFPAVTHFADAINALPKELVRHFTLLKEVDAKIFAPEEALFQLIGAALNAPPPDPVRSLNDASSTVAPLSAYQSSSGDALNGRGAQRSSPDISTNVSVFDPANLPRRQLFRQAAFKIQEMLVSLEEKNHVISTANDALQKQLARIDDVWPHLEGEFSDEAKWGSDTHWAYPENRAARDSNNQAERTRREGAASLSAAAQSLAQEEAAARSDARKQAVAAKKSQKNHAQPADTDDHDGKAKPEPTKKSQSSSKRKTAAAPAADTAPGVGLGISTPVPANGTPASKRRKVEKSANGGTQMERAMSSVFGGKDATKAKGSASPRETPAPEPAKKRKALPNSNGQAKKRAGPGATPSVASSPVVGTFPDSSKPSRASPAPSIAARPASSRARQTSTQPNVEAARQRPDSAALHKPNGVVPVVPEFTAPSNGSRAQTETKTQKETPAPSTSETPKPDSEPAPVSSSVTVGGTKKEGSARPMDEVEGRKEPTPTVPAATTTLVTTKSGRASKPSTPAIGTFAEAARSRPSRNSESTTAQKRSHKKGASAAAAAAAQKALAQQQKDEDNSSIQDDEEVDENEPTYCYCNRISYGAMVACDGLNCKREWFHMECVGLKVAPKANVKWYCEDCKEQMKTTAKKANGR